MSWRAPDCTLALEVYIHTVTTSFFSLNTRPQSLSILSTPRTHTISRTSKHLQKCPTYKPLTTPTVVNMRLTLSTVMGFGLLSLHTVGVISAAVTPNVDAGL